MMLMEVRQDAFSYGEEESKNSVTGGGGNEWTDEEMQGKVSNEVNRRL